MDFELQELRDLNPEFLLREAGDALMELAESVLGVGVWRMKLEFTLGRRNKRRLLRTRYSRISFEIDAGLPIETQLHWAAWMGAWPLARTYQTARRLPTWMVGVGHVALYMAVLTRFLEADKARDALLGLVPPAEQRAEWKLEKDRPTDYERKGTGALVLLEMLPELGAETLFSRDGIAPTQARFGKLPERQPFEVIRRAEACVDIFRDPTLG